MFGLLTRFCYDIFDARRYGQHHDRRRADVDTDTDTDIDAVDDDCTQSRRLQRHAPAQ